MIDEVTQSPLALALRTARRHLIAAALFSGLVNLLYLVPSIFMLQVYDRVVPTRGTSTLVLLAMILTVALVVFAVLDLVRMRLLLRASIRLEKLAAPAILHRVLGGTGAGAMQRARALRDFDTIRATMTGPAILALFDAPWIPIYVAVCFMLHPWIGAMAVGASLVLAAVAAAGERASTRGIAEAAEWTATLQRTQDYSVQASEVARALGMREAVVRRHLGERARLVERQGEVAERSGGFLAITKFLRLLFQSLALALGAWLAIRQEISGGAIFAASLLLGRALAPVEQILGSWRSVLNARHAYASLTAFLALPDATAPRTSLPAPRGAIDVSGVSVRVPGSDRALLKDVGFAVAPGEIVAVVGPSGAGKSTLLRVVAGALAADAGDVRIDGASLADWDRETLGSFIGYMPQTPSLFPASVKANIARLGARRDLSPADLDAAVIDAARQAGAHEAILRLPNGYDTMLTMGEDGGLSAGQRQLIALSRALFGRPSMLILDEPNAHLDMNGEAMLADTIKRLRDAGNAVLVSSHRPGLLQVADKVLLLRDGAVQFFRSRDDAMRPPPPVAAAKAGETA